MVTGSPPSPRRTANCREHARYAAINQDERFIVLRRKKRRSAIVITTTFAVWYSLYVAASVFARGLMRHRLAGHVNVALTFGLLQFASTFVLARVYSRYSRVRLEPLRAQVVADAERRGHPVAGGGRR